MSKSGSDNPKGQNPGTFLGIEEALRGRLPSGKTKLPQPHFVQPDTGVAGDENTAGGHNPYTVEHDPTTARLKSGNVETDITGGLY